MSFFFRCGADVRPGQDIRCGMAAIDLVI